MAHQDINVVIGSVRSAHFTGPLDAAASSFYNLFEKLKTDYDGIRFDMVGGGGGGGGDGGTKSTHPVQLNFDYFNAVPSGQKPRADFDVLKKADVFLLVAENEFQYADGSINPLYRQHLDNRLEKIRDHLRDKTVIVLNSDIRHSPELIQDYTLKGTPLRRLGWIEENDFPGNVHTLKYWELQKQNQKQKQKRFQRGGGKTTDFAYWGSWRDKTGTSPRKQVLKALKREHPDIDSLYIGHLPPHTDRKWTRKFIEVIPDIQRARCTLCFGPESEGDSNRSPGETADWLTAKYHEAMGAGVIPFVWDRYDDSEQLGILPWQRVSAVPELVDRIKELRNETYRQQMWKEIEQSYRANILSEERIYDQWEEMVLTEVLA